MRRRSVVVVPSDDWGWRDVRPALKRLTSVEVVGVARSVGEARSLAAERPLDALVAADRLNGRSSVADLVALRPLLAPGAKLVVFAERLDAEAIARLDDFALDGLFLWSCLNRRDPPARPGGGPPDRPDRRQPRGGAGLPGRPPPPVPSPSQPGTPDRPRASGATRTA